MKKVFSIALFLFVQLSFGQNYDLTDEFSEYYKKQYPEINLMSQHLEQLILNHTGGRIEGTTAKIPVVFHIVHAKDDKTPF